MAHLSKSFALSSNAQNCFSSRVPIRALHVIAGSVAKMNAMCGRLSLLTRELELQRTEVDLNELVQDTLTALNGSLRATLTYVPGHVPKLLIDPEQMQKVLENLLLNAYEATETEGDIRIATAQQERWALLTVFQAMDAAGKDSTIRKVFSGVNPAGFRVHSFGRPSEGELRHDFLQRVSAQLPERGKIGVFNRSHYEEVLVVRVNPAALAAQNLPETGGRDFWEGRFESIREFEEHLARNGTLVVKFWLNVSRREQKKRLLERIDDPEKNWKFRMGDLDDRAHWDDYMSAYEELLRATSRPCAPWFAIPANDKDYMRAAVAKIRAAGSACAMTAMIGERRRGTTALGRVVTRGTRPDGG